MKSTSAFVPDMILIIYYINEEAITISILNEEVSSVKAIVSNGSKT